MFIETLTTVFLYPIAYMIPIAWRFWGVLFTIHPSQWFSIAFMYLGKLLLFLKPEWQTFCSDSLSKPLFSGDHRQAGSHWVILTELLSAWILNPPHLEPWPAWSSQRLTKESRVHKHVCASETWVQYVGLLDLNMDVFFFELWYVYIEGYNAKYCVYIKYQPQKFLKHPGLKQKTTQKKTPLGGVQTLMKNTSLTELILTHWVSSHGILDISWKCLCSTQTIHGTGILTYMKTIKINQM